jgi:predicted phosphodiesterase
MTAIGLISDVHAKAAPVREALVIFAREHVRHVFCAGDIAGYHDELDETLALFAAHGVRAVRGNHDLRYLEARGAGNDDPAAAWLRRLPAAIDTVLDGRRLYIVHAEPPDACGGGGIRLLDPQGRVRADRADQWRRRLAECACDVLIVGHTHQVFAARLGAKLVVNPGSTVFNHSCAVLRLPELSVETFALSGQAMAPYWNWSEYMRDKA